MPKIISIDPGLSTGLVVGSYTDDTPFVLEKAFQIPDGLEGFIKSVQVTHGEDWGLNLYGFISLPDRKVVDLYQYKQFYHDGWADCDGDHNCPEDALVSDTTVLVEKFTARGGGNQGFSYRTKDLEPLRVEGAIRAIGIDPVWVSPSQQYFLGGKDKAAKKKVQHAWLKEHGYYISPKSVGASDADDARSATAHIISYLRRIKHKPTLEMFKGD